MRAAAYLAGYVLDFFRERVAAADFAGARIERVLLAPGFDEAGVETIRRLFPHAELHAFGERPSLSAIRSVKPDVTFVPMTGGRTRDRLVAMLSGAKHTLLVPSPDYVYRFGMRRGVLAFSWAVVDRFLLAPFALVWLMILGAAMYATGLVSRSLAAERSMPWRPDRALLIRLVPTTTFLWLLTRLRRRFPDVHITALLASEEGRAEIAQVADEVVSPKDGGIVGTVRHLRSGRFDAVLLAGGADYEMGLSYLKAVVLARIAPASARYQWEIGDSLPGTPLRRAMWRALTVRREEAGATPGWLGRRLLRRRYAREPVRGPDIVQIGITKACNYHCLFCPFHNPQVDGRHREADQPRMSYEMFARLLGELRRLGTRAIDICGDGEPLTHPEALDMIALARDLGFAVTLATNAALLTEDRARRLVELGVRRMHISFNAATDDVYERLHPGAPPGTRARIVERLREMAEYAEAEGFRPIDVEFSAVLNRLNMHQIPQMVEAAHEARAGWFMLILMGPAEGAEELLPRAAEWGPIRSDIERAAINARHYGIRTNLDAIRPGASAAGTESIYQHIPCYIGHEYALITADGSVMFCCQCSHPVGNLRQESFRQIWYSETYRQAREQARCLPRRREHVPGCECFTACSHVVVNLDVYRKLYGERAARSVT